MFQIILSFFIMFLSEKKYFDLAQTFLLFFSEPKTNQIEHFYTIAVSKFYFGFNFHIKFSHVYTMTP